MNTRHILFIVSGAFDKLSEVVKQRMEQSSIGFIHEDESGDKHENEYLKDARAEDFIKYGFEPEFIGRLPIRIACDRLTVDDLEQILLKSEDSILDQYRQDFMGYNIAFDMTREAIREIATRSSIEKTGARGLMTQLERVFRDYKFELPSTSIKSFEVKSETIEHPQEELKKVLLDNAHLQNDVLRTEIEAFTSRFNSMHGLNLSFEEAAVAELVQQSLETGKTIRSLCDEKFKDFHFGLKLIAARTGRTAFTITRETVRNPDKDLSRWVVENYPRSEGAAGA